MTDKLRIMLIEDSAAYRKGIACALEAQPNMELISEFGTAEIALRKLGENPPDLILLDLNLPGMKGLDALPLIKAQAPESKVIILTQSDKEADVLQAIELGAAGYLLKASSIEQLVNGIHLVRDGGATLDPNLARFILDTLQQNLSQPSAKKHLSKRELEILTLIAEGLAQKQIAAELQISIYTVTEHIHNIYDKLNVPNAPAAVAKAFKTGLFRQT
jgi:DNA-binding NarL/FixJ family response regulator